jgi:hypothetical protein
LGYVPNVTQYDWYYNKKIDVVEDQLSHKIITGSSVGLSTYPRCPLKGNLNQAKELRQLVQTSKDGNGSLDIFGYARNKTAALSSDKPVVLVSLEYHQDKPQHKTQFQNFLCGLERLGLRNRTVVLAMNDAAAELIANVAPEVIMLDHKMVREQVVATGKDLNIEYPNRIAKVFGAVVLLLMNYTVLVADTDTYWFKDPTAELMATNGGILAMQDFCPLDFNTGFIMYRPIPEVKKMFRILFSSDLKENRSDRYTHPHDNDQYLLNCAAAASALDGGVRPVFLRRNGFHFGGQISKTVCDSLDQFYIWHTSGMSTDSGPTQIQQAGLIDVDEGSVKCVDHFLTHAETMTKMKSLCETSTLL